MELIDRENHQKLYHQLFSIIRKKIESGEWPVGSQIPTEEELCHMFSVSRATVRTAVLDLVRQGYLKRQQGKGTFICRSMVSEGLVMTASIRELLFDEKLNILTNVLAKTVMMPIDELDVMLDIQPDKHIIYIKRLHFINNEPVLLQETYIPYHICPLLLEEDVEHQSLLDICEKKFGIKITSVKSCIDVAILNHNEGGLLKQAEGSCAILLMQYFYSGETLILYTRSVKNQNRFQLIMEHERKII
jgi:GntR family transcriptional regulator